MKILPYGNRPAKSHFIFFLLLVLSVAQVYAQAPVISYVSPQVYHVGVEITTLYPTNTGGTPVTYTVSPALPDGVRLDPAQGYVNGIPTAASPATDYMITATNSSGSSSATLNITIPNNVDIAHFGLEDFRLSPNFSPSILNYTVGDFPGDTTSVIELASPVDFSCSVNIYINGTLVTTPKIPIPFGHDVITTVVTSKDKTLSKTYTITIDNTHNIRLASLNLNLARRILTPVFNPIRYQYNVSAGNLTTTVTFTAAILDPAATMKVNGITTASGTPLTYPLAVGPNIFNIAVTAQDGVSVETYTLNVTRDLPSNRNLTDLAISSGTLSPAFDTHTNHYQVNVPYATTSIAVTPTASNYLATITVNGVLVSSKTASAAIPLFIGNNTITTKVTAADGEIQYYEIVVARPLSSDPNLADLADLRDSLLSNTNSLYPTPALTPAFSPATTNYSLLVPNIVTQIALAPLAGAIGATVTVNGTLVASGTRSPYSHLNPGTNVIPVIVTSQNGTTTKTYTITVTRRPSPRAGVAEMTLSTGSLSPIFGISTTNYTAQEITNTSAITLMARPYDPDATFTVNGVVTPASTPSASLPLAYGPNTISVVVTASDGTATETYTIIVTRAFPANANINHLVLSNGTLSPTFAQATTSYTASVANSVSSITLTPSTTDPDATVTVDGTPVASGTASDPVGLSVGSNVITMVGTAQDGVTTKTYTITVTRDTPGPVNSALDAISVTTPADRQQTMGEELIVHQYISPNGDGINDFLIIEGITNYPDNTLTIINRAGQVVFEAKNYDNSTKVFDGHSTKTGAMQLPGTYFYSLDYSVKGVARHKTGFIVLKY